MSMHPQSLPPIPEETARIARAAYRKGSIAMRLRDAIGPIYTDEAFAHLFARRGQPAIAPWRLALILVLQQMENLTDQQAADAVRGRLDWKYALSLELSDPGFDPSVLPEFRARLVETGTTDLVLDRLVDSCREQGWIKERGKQRTDSTHVLAAVRGLSYLEKVGETMRAALNELAEVAPEWLVQQISPDWFDRYSHRVENYRLPKGEVERKRMGEQIGEDGWHLLCAIQQAPARESLRSLPSVLLLQAVWEQHYEFEQGRAHWRKEPAVPQAELIASPYDPEARAGTKRDTSWLGYKVQVSETCDEEQVHLIVQVETTVAPVPDVERTTPIQEKLRERGLAPSEQLMDNGYVSGRTLVQSRAADIELVGPVSADTSWQGRAGQGFAAADFEIDWHKQEACCPAGQVSVRWRVRQRPEGEERITVTFARTVCQACPLQELCTVRQDKGRVLSLHAQPVQEALEQRRHEQRTPQFQQRYAARAGIEGTLSQGVRAMGLRRSRYRGLDKTHLQHVTTAAAINLVRVDAWLTRPARRAPRSSRFAQLQEEKIA